MSKKKSMLDKIRAKQGLVIPPAKEPLGVFNVPPEPVDVRGARTCRSPSQVPNQSNIPKQVMGVDLALSGADKTVKAPLPRPAHQITTVNRDLRLKRKPRLPDGSTFAVQYAAATQSWHGALTIQTEAGPEVYTGQGVALFGLLEHLDNCYRKNLAAKALPGSGEAVQ